jgi:hypothetical protein
MCADSSIPARELFLKLAILTGIAALLFVISWMLRVSS